MSVEPGAAAAASVDTSINELRVDTPPPTPSAVTEPSITPTTPTSPHLSWLAVRLLESGVDAQLAKDCELKLVVQEGFVSETLFSKMLPSELDSAYLKEIGIVGRGVQLMIIRLHNELYAQYSPVSPSPPPPPPPPVLSEVRPHHPEGLCECNVPL